MPLSTTPNKSASKSRGIINLLAMVQEWNENLRKGKDGEEIVYEYLVKQGYQVNVIASHNIEKSGITFNNDHKENTVFSPDFLACKGDEILFVDSKAKSHKGSLGWINVSDYEKYYDTMEKINGIGFRIYFPIKERNEIWVMEKLVSASEFPEPFPSTDGRLTYKIPEKFLKNYGVTSEV